MSFGLNSVWIFPCCLWSWLSGTHVPHRKSLPASICTTGSGLSTSSASTTGRRFSHAQVRLRVTQLFQKHIHVTLIHTRANLYMPLIHTKHFQTFVRTCTWSWYTQNTHVHNSTCSCHLGADASLGYSSHRIAPKRLGLSCFRIHSFRRISKVTKKFIWQAWDSHQVQVSQSLQESEVQHTESCPQRRQSVSFHFSQKVKHSKLPKERPVILS